MPDNGLVMQRNHVPASNKITIVSGLPRSGTSMLMHVLEAGGMPPLTDWVRAADADNPKGYYEFERVKRLPQGDVDWLDEARGRCVKVISALLTYLPPTDSYNVIFMHRHIDEVLNSQRKMLVHLGQATNDNDQEMTELLQQHVDSIRSWVVGQPNFSLFDADYNGMLASPANWVARITKFLGADLDAEAMRAAVDATLYRNRRS